MQTASIVLTSANIFKGHSDLGRILTLSYHHGRLEDLHYRHHHHHHHPPHLSLEQQSCLVWIEHSGVVELADIKKQKLFVGVAGWLFVVLSRRISLEFFQGFSLQNWMPLSKCVCVELLDSKWSWFQRNKSLRETLSPEIRIFPWKCQHWVTIILRSERSTRASNFFKKWQTLVVGVEIKALEVYVKKQEHFKTNVLLWCFTCPSSSFFSCFFSLHPLSAYTSFFAGLFILNCFDLIYFCHI